MPSELMNLQDAALKLGKADEVVREQMAEKSAQGHLTRYADLPGWKDYEDAQNELISAALRLWKEQKDA